VRAWCAEAWQIVLNPLHDGNVNPAIAPNGQPYG